MRLIDADQAKEQIKQMESLNASERMLFNLALERTPTYDPPNPPLTLEELWEMNGEPVFITKKSLIDGVDGWAIVDAKNGWMRLKNGSVLHFVGQGGYEKTWMAYRRKPGDGTAEHLAICTATGIQCSMCQPGPCESRRETSI